MRDFSVTVVDHADPVVLVLSGTLTGAAQEVLAAAADTSGSGRLVLDFTSVDYINSTGIAVIVGLLAAARSDGRSVAAFGLADHYRELFRITRLAEYVELHDTAEAAGVERPRPDPSPLPSP